MSLQSKILEVISDIEKDKKSRKVMPTHALLTEVITKAKQAGITREEVLEEIEHRAYWGEIEIGNTINDKFIKTV